MSTSFWCTKTLSVQLSIDISVMCLNSIVLICLRQTWATPFRSSLLRLAEVIFSSLEAHSPAVKDSNCLQSLTLWTHFLVLHGIYCRGLWRWVQTLYSSVPPLIRLTFVRCHLCPCSMYLTPLLFSLSLCRGCDKGWQRRECLLAFIVAGLTSAATFHILLEKS